MHRAWVTPLAWSLVASAVLGLLVLAWMALRPALVPDGLTDEAGLSSSSYCSMAYDVAGQLDADTSEVYSRGVLRVGAWTVDVRRDGFRQEHPSNPAVTLQFHSLAWALPQSSGQVAESVRLVLDYADRNPDVGSDADRVSGWNESAVTLRTRSVLCVYDMASPEERQALVPVLRALAEANMDEQRYYGPPGARPHNHGLLADRELLNLSRVLAEPAWQDLALARMSGQLDGMYDECGAMLEQSSAYQFVHVRLWASLLSRVPDGALRDRIARQVDQSASFADALAYPSGVVPAVGDGREKPVDDLVRVAPDVAFLCPVSGWWVKRMSFTSGRQQWIVRFGPGTTMHGHADKGQVLWWVGAAASSDAGSTSALGGQVLVDRGLPGKNRDEAFAYAVGPRAHPVFVSGVGSSGGSTVQVKRGGMSALYRASSDAGVHTRRVSFAADRPRLTLVDAVSGPAGSSRGTVNLPLDPVWSATSKSGEFRSDSGRILQVSCTRESTGANVPVQVDAVQDYQLSSPRPAVTLSCSVARASDGVRAVLEVLERPTGSGGS